MPSIHENIVSLLRDAAEVVNSGGRFIYGRELHSSMDFPNMAKPSDDALTLIALLPFTVADAAGPDDSFASADISMVFLRSADVQDNAAREEAIINEMSQLADNYKVVLKDSGLNDYSVRGFNSQAEYQVFLGTQSGVVLTFTVNYILPCDTAEQQALIDQFVNDRNA